MLKLFTKCLAGFLLLVCTAFGQSGFLGLQLADIDAGRAARLHLKEETGVEITGLVENSPAQDAGLHIGDALLSYNGETILGGQQLMRLVAETPVGRRVRIEYWRSSRQNNTVVTIAQAPPVARLLTNPDRQSLDVPASPDIPVAMVAWQIGMLGIECEEISPQMAHVLGVNSGVLVRTVQKDSPAANAGLRANDLLLVIEDRPLRSPRDLTSFCRSFAEAKPSTGKFVSLSVLRDRKTLALKLALPE